MESQLEQLNTNNYLIIDNFIEPKYAKQLHNMFKYEVENNPQQFVFDSQCSKSFSIYNAKPFLEILIDKIPHISNIVEQLVFPTYNYARYYKNGEILEKHTDRPACEVSITLHLDSDGVEWPIWFTKPNKETISVNIKPGQAILYNGMISEHWRNEYTGDSYSQVFLHYVRSQGQYWQEYFDNIGRSK
jgi:hypothetical protein